MQQKQGLKRWCAHPAKALKTFIFSYLCLQINQNQAAPNPLKLNAFLPLKKRYPAPVQNLSASSKYIFEVAFVRKKSKSIAPEPIEIKEYFALEKAPSGASTKSKTEGQT